MRGTAKAANSLMPMKPPGRTRTHSLFDAIAVVVAATAAYC